MLVMEEWMVLGGKECNSHPFSTPQKMDGIPHSKIEEWWMVSLLFWMATQVWNTLAHFSFQTGKTT